MSKRLTRYISTVLILAGSTLMTGCTKSDNSTASNDVEASVAAAQPVVNAAEITSEATSKQIPAAGSTSTPMPVQIATTPGEQIPADYSSMSPTALEELRAGTTQPADVKMVPPVARVQGSVVSARSVLKIEPSILNLGQLATNETKAATVTLTNISDADVTIERAKTSCGCTTTGLDPGTVIGPGESVDVKISLRGGARAQVLNKTVTFIVAGMDPIQLPVRGQTIEYVKITPSSLDQASNPEGEIVIRAIDNEVFKITGMSPPLMEEADLPQESKVEHVIKFPWDRLEDFGFTRRITFHLDHPKAEQVFFTIKRDPGKVIPNARGERAVAPFKTAASPRVGMALIALMFQKGQTDEIIAKLDKGLNVESKDTTGLTVLGLACRYAKGDFVQTIIERGADIESQDGAGRTPLMTASQYGNLEAVQALIDSGAQINGRDRIGNTPISWAAGFGNAACVSELIENGADIEAVSTVTGWTPLIWAAGFGEPASVEVIIAAGANLEVADIMQGATPLINAARTGKPESLSALINAGAKIDAKDRNGKTALLSACENSGGTPEKVKLLIAAGSDVFITDNRGRSAYQLATARTDTLGPEVAGILKPYFENRTPE